MVKIISPKNTLIIFISILVLAIIAAGIASFLILKFREPEISVQPPQEKTPEEILNSLATSPETETGIQREILESLAVPPK